MWKRLWHYSLPVLILLGIVVSIVGWWLFLYLLDDGASSNSKSVVGATEEVISGGANIVDAWDATDPAPTETVVTTPPRGRRECPGVKIKCEGKCTYPENCRVSSPDDLPAEEVVFPPITIEPEGSPADLQLPDDWQQDTDTVGGEVGSKDPTQFQVELGDVVVYRVAGRGWIGTAFPAAYFDRMADQEEPTVLEQLCFSPYIPPLLAEWDGMPPTIPPLDPWEGSRHPLGMLPMVRPDTGEVMVIRLGQAVLEMGPPTQVVAPLPLPIE